MFQAQLLLADIVELWYECKSLVRNKVAEAFRCQPDLTLPWRSRIYFECMPSLPRGLA